MLGICDGDGYRYYNGEKQLEAFCFEAGEKWYDSQSYLCVNREKFLSQLGTHNLNFFGRLDYLDKPLRNQLKNIPNFIVEMINAG